MYIHFCVYMDKLSSLRLENHRNISWDGSVQVLQSSSSMGVGSSGRTKSLRTYSNGLNSSRYWAMRNLSPTSWKCSGCYGDKHFHKAFSVDTWGLFASSVSDFYWRGSQSVYVMNLRNKWVQISGKSANTSGCLSSLRTKVKAFHVLV